MLIHSLIISLSLLLVTSSPTPDDCQDQEFHVDPDNCPESYYRCYPDGNGGWNIEVGALSWHLPSNFVNINIFNYSNMIVLLEQLSILTLQTVILLETGLMMFVMELLMDPPDLPPHHHPPHPHPPTHLMELRELCATTAPGHSTDLASASLTSMTLIPMSALTSTMGSRT